MNGKNRAMSGRVLIDTSAWITFFRGKDPVLADRIAEWLRAGRAVYTGIIGLELIRRAKGKKELQIIYDAFDAMDCIAVDEAVYLHAGALGYELARKGHTLGTMDLLIAQIAMDNRLSLLTYDQHFDLIAKHSTLQLLIK